MVGAQAVNVTGAGAIMKKLALILTLFVATTAFAASKIDGTFPFLFNGRWQPAENPLHIVENGYRDIQNLRKDGDRLRGVSGHSKITSAKPNATYYLPRAGYHYRKDQPQESHILLQAWDSTETDARLYRATSTIPDAATFAISALNTDDTDGGIGRFSPAPQGQLLYTNGQETLIWGGTEFRSLATFLSDAETTGDTVSNARDYSAEMQDSSDAAADCLTIDQTGYGYMLIGSPRPLTGFRAYLKTANTDPFATLEVKYWKGSWASVSSLSDNSDGFQVEGFTTWTAHTDAAIKYLEGFALYWYQVKLTGGSAVISHITLNADMQTATNVWDSDEFPIGGLKVYDGTTFEDYTLEAQDDTTEFLVILDSFSTANHKLYVGSTERIMGAKMWLLAGKENGGAASVLSGKYWDGDSWVELSGLSDGTSEGGVTFAKTGLISWSPVAAGLEFKKQLDGSAPMYWYEFAVTADFDAECEVYHVTTITIQDDIGGYGFPALFQNRSFLCDETGGHRNSCRYSAYNSPHIWNGNDSDFVYFGSEERVVAAVSIYNLFRTTGYEQMLVAKKSETYRLFGNGPEEWEIQQMSATVGCAAPQSMVVCEVSDIPQEQARRHVAIWQTATGVVQCDGAVIQPISHDIRHYWDRNHADAIPADRIDDSVGWYDPHLRAYKLLISSGSGQTTHNVELEYSLLYRTWTKIYRENADGANPLQVGFSVYDTNGNHYSYGATDEGLLYRLENGANWAGTDIEQYVHTKEFTLDPERPFFRDSYIDYIRLAFEDKNAANTLGYLLTGASDYLLIGGTDKLILATAEEITIAHYCDGVATTNGVDLQLTPETVAPADGFDDVQNVHLGHCMSHSFKISMDVNQISDGMELLGLGLWFTSDELINLD
jgi:hypothetical protein